MNHDADYLDIQEFLQMDYKHCLKYLHVFFKVSDHGSLFPIDHGTFGIWDWPEEIEDKLRAMINRGYLVNHSKHYLLLSIGPRGFNIMEQKSSLQEIHSEL